MKMADADCCWGWRGWSPAPQAMAKARTERSNTLAAPCVAACLSLLLGLAAGPGGVLYTIIFSALLN